MYKFRQTNSKGIVKIIGVSDDIKVVRQLGRNVIDSVRSLNDLEDESGQRYLSVKGDSISIIFDEGAKKTVYDIIEESMLRKGEKYMTMSMVTKRA